MKFLPFIFFSLSFFTAQSVIAHNKSPTAYADLQQLSSEKMTGRLVGTEGSALAREYIIQRVTEIGLTPCNNNQSFVQEFQSKNRKSEFVIGKNIIACLAGKKTRATSVNQNKSILVSAHYDHLGEHNGRIYHGADDNASGVAAALALATNMKENPPNHSVIFAFFDAEEYGLQGAMAYVKNSKNIKDHIAININFDMVARIDKNEIYASGTYYTPQLKTILEQVKKTPQVQLLIGHDKPEQGVNDWTSQSDHFAFFKAGVPHLYFGVEDHADYHKTSDTSDKINPLLFQSSIDLLTESVRLIDHGLLTHDLYQFRKNLPMK